MLTVLLIALLLLALGGGLWAGPRYGYAWGISPLGLIILLIVVLWLTGNISLP